MSTTQQRFALGQTCATPGALESLSDAGQDAAQFLSRHQSGDWGDLSDEDKQENEFSVDKRFENLLSLSSERWDKDMDHHRGGQVSHYHFAALGILKAVNTHSKNQQWRSSILSGE